MIDNGSFNASNALRCSLVILVKKVNITWQQQAITKVDPYL